MTIWVLSPVMGWIVNPTPDLSLMICAWTTTAVSTVPEPNPRLAR